MRQGFVAIKAVVLDLDGTVVEFNLDYKSARAEVIQFLSAQGFPRSLFSIKESVFEMLKKVEISMKNNGKDLKEFARLRETALALLEKYELESASSTSPLPGVFETLKALKKAGLKLALFTVNSQKSTNYILETLRLKEFFDAVVTRNSVPFVKPNPIHLETALKALKVKPEEAVVVGDSIWDMKSAQEMSVFAVGATTGVSSPEELTRAGANCLVSSLTDLIVLVEQLNKMQSEKDVKTS
jgi:HAD superfamily hydrolase (TIGR01509 family)